MAKKAQLREQRSDTVINQKSKRQEKALNSAIGHVISDIQKKWPALELRLEPEWKLADVAARLGARFTDVSFHYHFARSSMRPDGGILSLVAPDGECYPILIAEKKNQGTNDQRKAEGKRKQAKGNAIERLGKNVIGFRTALKGEAIFPFVCFGDGCDFAPDSSILDRVSTIAMFGELNVSRVHHEGAAGEFDRGSFYFREAEWTEAEMVSICTEIAISSIYYYFSKYGEARFLSGA